MIGRQPLCDFQQPSKIAVSVKASLRVEGSLIILDYLVCGDLALIDFEQKQPAAPNPIRGHNLWKQTCFEAFWGFQNDPQYWELNVSANRSWNVYHFSDYRQTMKEEPAIQAIDCKIIIQTATEFNLQVCVQLPTNSRKNNLLEFNLCAVLKPSAAEDNCYFAIQHAPKKPDFHFRSAFLSYDEKK